MTLLNLYGRGRGEPKKWFPGQADRKVSITLYFFFLSVFASLCAKNRILAVRQLAMFRAEEGASLVISTRAAVFTRPCHSFVKVNFP